MKVYKYRGGNFERDLEALEKNYYWAPKFDDLNDPCETIINTDRFKIQSKALIKLFGKGKSEVYSELEKALHNVFEVRKKGIGIYSLSKTYKDELLWAHYANSHKGFCIEYDLDILSNSYKSFETYSFPVMYKKSPPEYGVRDINNTKTEQVVKKLAGFKSKRWEYEQEYRIVTGFFGEHPYDHKCLKSIYFGLKMDESKKRLMMQKLKGRNIQFYQIIQKYNSYEFDSVKINDLRNERYSYFKEIPAEITNDKPVQFNIKSKSLYRERRGTIEIELASKVDRNILDLMAQKIKTEMLRNVERIFISYELKNDLEAEGSWATSKYEKDHLETKIHGLTCEQEKSLVNILSNDNRATLGKWIDETPFASAGVVLLEDNGEFVFENYYHDGSYYSTKVTATKQKGVTRYDDLEDNIHGEYYLKSDEGILSYCSEEGVFRTLKPFSEKNYQ